MADHLWLLYRQWSQNSERKGTFSLWAEVWGLSAQFFMWFWMLYISPYTLCPTGKWVIWIKMCVPDSKSTTITSGGSRALKGPCLWVPYILGVGKSNMPHSVLCVLGTSALPEPLDCIPFRMKTKTDILWCSTHALTWAPLLKISESSCLDLPSSEWLVNPKFAQQYVRNVGHHIQTTLWLFFLSCWGKFRWDPWKIRVFLM